MLGSDAQGRAVLLFQVRKHNAWARKLDELERFCCYLLDMTVGEGRCGAGHRKTLGAGGMHRGWQRSSSTVRGPPLLPVRPGGELHKRWKAGKVAWNV